MNEQTIECIRYALHFMRSVNVTIATLTHNPDRLNQAIVDIQVDNNVIDDFEKYVKSIDKEL